MGTFWFHLAQIRKVLLYFNLPENYSISVFYQRTLLHLAVEEGREDTVKYLVQKGASIDTKDGDGVSMCGYTTESKLALLI